MALATIGFLSSLTLAGAVAVGVAPPLLAAQDAWTFALAIGALGTLKLSIGLRLWIRVDSVKEALPRLMPQGLQPAPVTEGTIDSPYGPATISRRAQEPLFIHRLAIALWAPMLLMGVMVVAIGFVVGLAAAGSAGDAGAYLSLRTLEPGILFLGEGLLLSGISFLLGSILGSIRLGGGEVQEALGIAVKTLKMPLTAKVFIGLMAMGMMVEMVQFVLYIVAAGVSAAGTVAVWTTWLGPLREAGLGILLTGIVLALATIAKALSFQFSRITEIIASGR